ncbi:MAG TPA: RecQ family ATP-dependent DNA helicase [Casimicrobiaceae bacterium]|nr:RecQ family ATP-dependent DNA helicase [Casimicrobiaceae bacterium]
MNKPAPKSDARALSRTLRRTFGITTLREGQERVIARVLKGRDTLAIMPTGAGKSLCYQLPALHLSGTTVVVSPLISLMKDQADKLADADVPNVQLNSTLGEGEERDALARVARGEIRIVFATPERMTDTSTLEALAKSRVALFVVDEAHCISQWGHDFRPAYLELAAALGALGEPPVLALTATATDEVARDIVTQLKRPAMRVVQTGIYRENLHYGVLHTTNDDERVARVVQVVKAARGAGIVYAATISVAETLAEALRNGGVRAGVYHGRLPARERRAQQDAFMDGRLDVMVATNAFGLGVDKPDVRYVLHAQMPGSIEAYYQESGRGGRDGEVAQCTLLYDLRDRRVQQFFLARRYPDAEQLEAVRDAIARIAPEGAVSFAALREGLPGISEVKIKVAIKLLVDAGAVVRRAGGAVAFRQGQAGAAAVQERSRIAELARGYAEKAEQDREKLERMVFYAQTGLCRWRVLLDYFGERLEQERCGNCDNCIRMARRERVAGPDVPRDSSAVAKRRRGYTIGDDVRVPRYGSGRVRGVTGDEVTIEFPNGDARTFLRSYVRRNARAAHG